MARKKKSKISPVVFKIAGVMIGSLIVGILLCNLLYQFVMKSEYFTVKKIVIDEILLFIEKKDLIDLEGKNIFSVNLKNKQRRLTYQYPQLSELKIVRTLPDQINIVAKRRDPVAQIQIGEKILTLDEKAIVLSIIKKKDKDLPSIKGLELPYEKISLGLPLKRTEVASGLEIIKEFSRSKSLGEYNVRDVEIETLSKINIYLSNDLKIIVDKDMIPKKMAVLGIVLKQDDLDFKEIRYIDLRFKEPILGKK